MSPKGATYPSRLRRGEIEAIPPNRRSSANTQVYLQVCNEVCHAQQGQWSWGLTARANVRRDVAETSKLTLALRRDGAPPYREDLSLSAAPITRAKLLSAEGAPASTAYAAMLTKLRDFGNQSRARNSGGGAQVAIRAYGETAARAV